MNKKEVYVVLDHEHAADIFLPVQLFLTTAYEVKGIYVTGEDRVEEYQSLFHLLNGEKIIKNADDPAEREALIQQITSGPSDFCFAVSGDLHFTSELLKECSLPDNRITVVWMGSDEVGKILEHSKEQKDIVATALAVREFWHIPYPVASRIRSSIAAMYNRLNKCEGFAETFEAMYEHELIASEKYRKTVIPLSSLAVSAVMLAPEYQPYEKKSLAIKKGSGYFYGEYKVIREYSSIDNRMVVEDLYAKILLYYESYRRVKI